MTCCDYFHFTLSLLSYDPILNRDKQQSNIIIVKGNAENDKEITSNYQRAKAFKPKNPFILFFMHPLYVSRPHNLYIPLKLARMYLRQKNSNLVLRVSEKGSSSVKYILLRKNAKVTSGWKTFVLKNKLKNDDVYALEVINDPKLSLICHHIFRDF